MSPVGSPRGAVILLTQCHIGAIAQIVVDVHATIAARDVDIHIGDDHIIPAIVVEVSDHRIAAKTIVTGGPSSAREVVEKPRKVGEAVCIVAVVKKERIGVVVGHDQIIGAIVVEIAHRRVVGGHAGPALLVSRIDSGAGGGVVGDADILRRVECRILDDVESAIAIHIPDARRHTECRLLEWEGTPADDDRA